ncbi:thioredoxin family protein [bacterium]|nr:thioredoxin family protein [bacterium]
MSAAGKARVPAWTWVVLLAAAAAAVFILRPAADERDAAEATVVTTLPRLIDLGADKCVPCKMMVPVLEELAAGYADRFEVEFIDVWKQPERGDAYAVNLIPTQIFLAADGTELFRHEGFFAKDDILAKWRELGLEL